MGADQSFCGLKLDKAFEFAGLKKTHETVKGALMEWLLERVAAVLEIPQDSIDVYRNLEDYGLDSLQAVGLAGDLQSRLCIDVQPTVIWDYASIEEACDFLAQLVAAPRALAPEADGDTVDARRNT